MGQDGAAPPMAQGKGPTAAVERLFGATTPEANWFTVTFVSAVPPQQVNAIVDGLAADVEWAPSAGRDHATSLTGGRACCFSYCAGLR